MKTNDIAIVVIAYNRELSLKRLLDSLSNAYYEGEDVTLIISIDKSDNTLVENVAKSFQWKFGEKKILMNDENLGLKRHVLKIGDLTNDYDAIIVLEDDLIVSRSFYRFSQKAYNFYKNDSNIAGISLYSFQKHWLNKIVRFEPEESDYDTYFLKIAQSWGQIWYKKAWTDFIDWLKDVSEIPEDNNLPYSLKLWPESSWLKYHDLYCIKNNKYFVYPYKGYSTNMGEVGTHAVSLNPDHQVEMYNDKTHFKFQKFNNSNYIYDEFMEREKLFDCFPKLKEDLIIDLYDSDYRTFNKRYILSTKILNFKILKSYSLNLRPIEINILLDYKGTGIYLYDSYSNVKNQNKRNKLLRYTLRTDDSINLFKFSINQLYEKIFNKIMIWRNKL